MSGVALCYSVPNIARFLSFGGMQEGTEHQNSVLGSVAEGPKD